MQVNLAGALGLFGLHTPATEDAQVAVDITTEEVQAKRMPPTTASIAIDEAIVEVMESAAAEYVEPDPPPILQPNKRLFEAQEKQPIADSMKLDGEWEVEKPIISPRGGETKPDDTPPILRPFPIASALPTPSPISAVDGRALRDADKQTESVAICYGKSDISDVAGTKKQAAAGRASDVADGVVPNDKAVPEPRMAPPLRPAFDPRAIALFSNAKAPPTIATENGDTFTLEWPLPWFPEDPTDPIYNDKSLGQQPAADVAPDAPAPGLRPHQHASSVDSNARVKVLDKLERLLARIAPDARAKILAVRDFAIKAAMDQQLPLAETDRVASADRAKDVGIASKLQPIADIATAVKQEVKRLITTSVSSDGVKDGGAPLPGTSRIPNAQAIIERVSQFFPKHFTDQKLRVLLPRDENPIVYGTGPATPHGPIKPESPKLAASSADSADARKVAPSVMTSVINRIEQMLDGRKGQSVTIRLDPPELGTIDVTVKTVSGRVDAQIIASSSDVRQFVEANRELLAQALANRGLELGSMSVGTQSHSSGQAQTPAKPSTPAWRPEVQSAHGVTVRWSTATTLDFSA